jgi:hypothetical protein
MNIGHRLLLQVAGDAVRGLRTFMVAECKRWGEVIREASMTLEK